MSKYLGCDGEVTSPETSFYFAVCNRIRVEFDGHSDFITPAEALTTLRQELCSPRQRYQRELRCLISGIELWFQEELA